MKKIIFLLLLMLPLLGKAQLIEPVPVDKQYHMGAGAVIGVWGFFAGNSLELNDEQSMLFGMGAVMAAGLGKDLWDVSWRLLGDETARFDPMDVAATALGGIISVALTYAGVKTYRFFKVRPFKPAASIQGYGYMANSVGAGIRITF